MTFLINKVFLPFKGTQHSFNASRNRNAFRKTGVWSTFEHMPILLIKNRVRLCSDAHQQDQKRASTSCNPPASLSSGSHLSVFVNCLSSSVFSILLCLLATWQVNILNDIWRHSFCVVFCSHPALFLGQAPVPCGSGITTAKATRQLQSQGLQLVLVKAELETGNLLLPSPPTFFALCATMQLGHSTSCSVKRNPDSQGPHRVVPVADLSLLLSRSAISYLAISDFQGPLHPIVPCQ